MTTSNFNPSTQPTPHTSSFYGLGIAPKLLEILDRLHFKVPTLIQSKAIPIAMEGKDVVGIAQTGTGKTLAFAIPMIQGLAQKKGKGLVLVPTRELAIQVDETIRKIAPAFGMRTAVLIGGASMGNQIQALRKNPRIIIATPGRLIDHMEQRCVQLNDVQILVIDEGDRMFDMGFAPQIKQILRHVPQDRQTMLFSATMPEAIMGLAAAYMKLPVRTEIAPSGTTAERITQEVFIIKKDTKEKLLQKLLAQYHGTILLFTRTKVWARRITRFIRSIGHQAAEIHSDRTLSQRREALEGFKAGRYRILVATDIASRGIDVTGIELVINYDLPDESENYVHRVGRTGRAGCPGHAISFAMPDQAKEVRSIERLIRTEIPIAEHPEVPMEKFFESVLPAAGARGHKRPAYSFGRRGGRFRSRRRF